MLQSVPNVQESPAIKGATVSEVIERPDPEGSQNTPNLNKVPFDKQSSNSPIGMPSREGEKG